MSDAAIDKLTDAERECLQRVLDHQTAKEMARDLGISHHAVEKRLKRAREKLGALTSLEAARRYGQTVSGLPDVEDCCADELDGTPHPDAPSRPRRSLKFMFGILIMAGALAATTYTIGGDGQVQGSSALADPNGPVRHTFTVGVADEANSDPHTLAFDMADKDGSGTIDLNEFRGLTSYHGGDDPSAGETADALAKIFAFMDNDEDGQIGRNEFASVIFNDDVGNEYSFEVEANRKTAELMTKDAISESLRAEIATRRSDALKTFARLDRDRSGRMDRAEWIEPSALKVGDRVGQVVLTVPEGSAERAGKIDLSPARNRRAAIFAVMDRDADGLVDKAEFVSHAIENSSGALMLELK